MKRGSKVLIVHPGVGPYRDHFFEELSNRISAHYLFYFKSIIRHPTDASALKLGPGSSMEWCITDRQNKMRPIRMLFRLFPRFISAFFRIFPTYIVVSEYSPISFVVACVGRLFGTEIVLWTDDSLDNAENISRIRKVQRYALFALAHRLIVINPDVANYFNGIFSGDIFTSLLLQPEGMIREELFAEKTTAYASELMNRYSLANAKIMLFVGRLSPEKNLSALIRSFHEAISFVTGDVRLVLVGSGIDEEKLRMLIENLGMNDRVIFAGYQPRDEHLWAWFRLAGMFVLPSLYEPFGAVVNESLICGVPVVISSRAGSSCLIKNSETGSVFYPESEGQLSQIISNRFSQCGLAGECLHNERLSLMNDSFDDAVNNFVNACK